MCKGEGSSSKGIFFRGNLHENFQPPHDHVHRCLCLRRSVRERHINVLRSNHILSDQHRNLLRTVSNSSMDWIFYRLCHVKPPDGKVRYVQERTPDSNVYAFRMNRVTQFVSFTSIMSVSMVCLAVMLLLLARGTNYPVPVQVTLPLLS